MTQTAPPGHVEPLANLGERLARASRVLRLALATVLLGAVGLLNLAAGTEISFSIFYLVPVAFAGALLSRGAGAAMAIASAALWGLIEFRIGPGYSAEWIPYWNGAVRLTFFLIFNEMIHRLREAHLRVRQLARIDALTGLLNARVFRRQLEQVIARSRRSAQTFSLAYVDLDRFKDVNDRLGHAEGDRALQNVAAHIRESVRVTDVVARLGGDEFGVLMESTLGDAAGTVLQRVIAASPPTRRAPGA